MNPLIRTALLAVIALHARVALAQSPREIEARGIFEKAIYQTCQGQVSGSLEPLKRELGALPSTTPLENRVCACTAKALAASPRIKTVLEEGPERLKMIGSDKDLIDFLKRKKLALMLQCSGAAIDRIVEPRNETGPASQERLHDAQVTDTRLNNGAVITNYKSAGSLQPNAELGCVTMREVTNKFNPPALLYAARKCVDQQEYAKASALMTTGSGFAHYDLKRLADRSTWGARSVLAMNAFAGLTPVQQEAFAKVDKELQSDPVQVKTYCAELTRIGPPAYEPQWAILHGIGAYEEPRKGHYLANVDTDALWADVLKNRCTPQKQ